MTHLGNTHLSDSAPRWTLQAIDRLRALAAENVPAEVIAQAMHRPMTEIVSKAAELGLALAPEDRLH